MLFRTILLFLISVPAEAIQDDSCGDNPFARELASLIINDVEQNRTVIKCNALLSKLAKEKAQKMQQFGLIQHNLGGSPNAHLENGGYKLPNYYGKEFHANQVEAIAGGYSTPEEVWVAFKNSAAHRSHLIGEHEFYLEQNEIGIGYVYEWHSPHIEYWVVYLTKGYSPSQSKFDKDDNLPNKSNLVVHKKEIE